MISRMLQMAFSCPTKKSLRWHQWKSVIQAYCLLILLPKGLLLGNVFAFICKARTFCASGPGIPGMRRGVRWEGSVCRARSTRVVTLGCLCRVLCSGVCDGTGAPHGAFGSPFRTVGSPMEPLGAPLEPLGAPLEPLGAPLGAPWSPLSCECPPALHCPFQRLLQS